MTRRHSGALLARVKEVRDAVAVMAEPCGGVLLSVLRTLPIWSADDLRIVEAIALLRGFPVEGSDIVLMPS